MNIFSITVDYRSCRVTYLFFIVDRLQVGQCNIIDSCCRYAWCFWPTGDYGEGVVAQVGPRRR